jgi:hypothetical protein
MIRLWITCDPSATIFQRKTASLLFLPSILQADANFSKDLDLVAIQMAAVAAAMEEARPM